MNDRGERVMAVSAGETKPAIELADLAKQIRPGLPVLLTSGYALETLVQQGRLPPSAMVLTKPYRKADLARRLREVVSVSELLSQSQLLAPAALMIASEKL